MPSIIKESDTAPNPFMKFLFFICVKTTNGINIIENIKKPTTKIMAAPGK